MLRFHAVLVCLQALALMTLLLSFLCELTLLASFTTNVDVFVFIGAWSTNCVSTVTQVVRMVAIVHVSLVMKINVINNLVRANEANCVCVILLLHSKWRWTIWRWSFLCWRSSTRQTRCLPQILKQSSKYGCWCYTGTFLQWTAVAYSIHLYGHRAHLVYVGCLATLKVLCDDICSSIISAPVQHEEIVTAFKVFWKMDSKKNMWINSYTDMSTLSVSIPCETVSVCNRTSLICTHNVSKFFQEMCCPKQICKQL